MTEWLELHPTATPPHCAAEGNTWHVCCERCFEYLCPVGVCYPDEQAAARARRLHMRWHNRQDRKARNA